MQNFILYRAFSPAEINACAYSLLKYLGVYNLKPPAGQAVVIYTNDPAALEAYGSFIHHFNLENASGNGFVGNTSTQNVIREFNERYKGNLLFLDSYCYPVKELEPLFQSVDKDRIFLRREFSAKASPGTRASINLLGINTSLRDPAKEMHTVADTDPAASFISCYSNFKEFDLLLKTFFTKYQEESIPNLVKLVSPLDADRMLEKKKAFSQLPLLTRVARKVTGKGWGMKEVMKKL